MAPGMLTLGHGCVSSVVYVYQRNRKCCSDSDHWPALKHMQSPSPPGCTFLSLPAAASPGRAVCCSDSHQMSAGHWETGLSLCWNPLDWTLQWRREPEPGEPPLCPTTHNSYFMGLEPNETDFGSSTSFSICRNSFINFNADFHTETNTSHL